MFCRRCGTRSSEGTLHCPLCGAGLQPGVAAVDPAQLRVTAPAEAKLVYAGFWRRAAAVLVDSLLMFFPLASMRVLVGQDMLGEWRPESTSWWVLTAVEIGSGWLYAAFLIGGRTRATLGLQVMRLEVCDLNGQRVGFARATGRYFAQFLTGLSLGIGYLMQVFTPRRQTLHDLVSRTVVVRTRHEVAPVSAPAPPAPPAPPAWGSSAS